MKKNNLFCTIIFLLLLSGCMPKTIQYHPQWGTQEENPSMYNSDKQDCTMLALQEYPLINPPQLMTLPPNLPSGSMGASAYVGRLMADIERHNKIAMQQYKSYNDARDLYNNQCMQAKGWHEIEIKKEK